MKTYICSLVVTILVSSACDSGIPTAPDPGVYTISGTVTEMTSSGPTPVEGAIVQIDFGRETLTDDRGLYTLTYPVALAKANNHSVKASKDGYTPIASSLILSADVRFDLQLRRLAPYTLSGQVFEVTASGRLPVEHVQLYCDGCGDPVGHTFAFSDANGEYRFEWTPNGITQLFVGKEGYALAGNQRVGPTSDSIFATVEGDTRFDIELVRR